MALTRIDRIPIGVWHCVMIVGKTSRRDPQRRITAALAVVDGASCMIPVILRGRSDTVSGWRASRESTYHEHPCVIYLDNIGPYLCYIISLSQCTVPTSWFSLRDRKCDLGAGDVEMKQVHVYSESSATSSILSQTSTYHLRVLLRAWLQSLSP